MVYPNLLHLTCDVSEIFHSTCGYSEICNFQITTQYFKNETDFFTSTPTTYHPGPFSYETNKKYVLVYNRKA